MYRHFYKKYLKKTNIKGNKLIACCPHPKHEDRNPSFNVELTTGKFHCFGCDWKGNAFTFAKQFHISYSIIPGYDPNYRSKNKHTLQTKPVKAYDYIDENGNLLYQVCRYYPKRFCQRQLDGNGGWIYNLNGVRRVLYRLPEILKSQKVIICEGEKDVDNLVALGYEATTCPGGAGKWKDEYNNYLKDKDVLIIPDNDSTGKRHAKDVAQKLNVIALSVKIIPLPESLGTKGDVTDFLNTYGKNILEKIFNSNLPEIVLRSIDRLNKDINTLPISDLGNAEAIAILYGSKIRYVHDAEYWLIWNGNNWQKDKDNEISRIAMECIRTRQEKAMEIENENDRNKMLSWTKGSESDYKIKSAIRLFKDLEEVKTTSDQFDIDPYFLGCMNGILDLKTGKLRAGQPEQMISKSTNISYDPNAKCQRWKQYLEEIFENNYKLINFVKRAIGYSLTGNTSEQCLFILIGPGENGKSLFLEILRSLTGEYCINTPFQTFEKKSNKGNQIPNDVAELVGMRIVTCSEINEYSQFDEGRIKSLTGEDVITARKLYKDFFSFKPTFAIWFALNHFPRVTDHSPGFWRRINNIPFNRQFTDDDRDRNLKNKLIVELSGILNWAIEGCLEWQKVGLMVPEIIKTENRKYQKESDTLSLFFEECTLCGKDREIGAQDLYDSYREWCKKYSIKPISIVVFGKRISSMGITKVKETYKRNTIYQGISLS
ncbi:hypothetical protein JXQ31_17025 [candidate division KSB1 bacterium]|nr:hypothetical protein [candidate division KSB1 bacterium]